MKKATSIASITKAAAILGRRGGLVKGENKAAAARRKGLAPLTEIFRVQEASPRSQPSTGSPFVKSLGMAPISFTFARRSETLSTT